MHYGSPLVASLLLLFAGQCFASADAHFGAPLNCQDTVQASALSVAAGPGGISFSEADGAWALLSMARIGYPATLPTSEVMRRPALVASALLRQGQVVAAKMVHDQAALTAPEYKAHAFANSFEALMTVLTQPVRHASYPTSVRADGEVRAEKPGHVHTHGVDIEAASASLEQVVARVGHAQRALGKTYQLSAVRYYILANAFRDAIALRASRASVCAEDLQAAEVTKLDVSARYVAMPSVLSANETKK